MHKLFNKVNSNFPAYIREQAMYIIAVIGLFILLCTLSGCPNGNPAKESYQAPKMNTELKIGNYEVQVVVIDGCEYLWVPKSKGAGLSHKGNCSNIFHLQNN